MKQEFNINQYVYIRLTEVGYATWKERHDDMYRPYPAYHSEIKPIEHYKQQANDEGFIKMQLWEVMQLFGHKMGNGMPVPFETEILLEIDPLF
jgi:hypothetical protein